MPRGIQTSVLQTFKPVFYRRYVDDIFVLLRKQEHLKLFLNGFNLYQENIKTDWIYNEKHKKYLQIKNLERNKNNPNKKKASRCPSISG